MKKDKEKWETGICKCRVTLRKRRKRSILPFQMSEFMLIVGKVPHELL
jgi:hypothetical protein